MSKKFLLVCEGPTDYHLINGISRKLSEIAGYPIQIQMLSPQLCASGQFERQGWTGIKNWCLKNVHKTEADLAAAKPETRAYLRRQSWRALVAFSRAQGLIIQMDTDIAEHISDSVVFDPTAKHRRAHCDEALKRWLKEPHSDEKLFFTLTTYALETWLLATYPPEHSVFNDLAKPFDYEALPDQEDRLIALGWKATKKKGKLRLKKSPSELYIPYGQIAADNIDVVRGRCREADDLCNHLLA